MKNQKIHINETTSTSGGGRGSYIAPLQMGVREFKDIDMQPFTIPVSKYNDAMLEYDSYDGKMSLPKKEINKIEKKAKKTSDYLKKHPYLTFSDEDGNVINQYPGNKKTIVPLKENKTQKKIVRLTERELIRIIKEIINEQLK